MADFFDIVDIVFAAVDGAGTGLPAYKHRAETGVKVDHIVVNTTGVAVKSIGRRWSMLTYLFARIPTV